MSKKSKKSEFVEPERSLRARDRYLKSEEEGNEHDLHLAVNTICAPYPCPDSAREILGHFCDSVEAGEWPDKLVMYYLADAFVEILDGKSADKSLGLIAPNYRPSKNMMRDQSIALEVYDLLEAGGKKAYAVAKVAERFNLEPGTIEGIWKDWKGRISRV